MEPSIKEQEPSSSMAHSPEDQIPIATNVIAEVTNQLKSKLRCAPNTGGVNGCCTNVLPTVKTGDSVNGLTHCKCNYRCIESPHGDPRYWSCQSYSCDGEESCNIACLGDCVPAALHSDLKRPVRSSSLDNVPPCADVSETSTRTRECLHQESQGVSTPCQGGAEKPPDEISEAKSASNLSESEISAHENQQICDSELQYVAYESEHQMPEIMRLIQKDLSEPYSIYTYRYFIHNWPKLCFLAMDGKECVGAIVCKLDMHKKMVKRGYIAMLAVDEKYRKRKIGSNLVLKAIHAMIQDDADEVVLETEVTNKPALRLYENLGFVRDKRLFRYYLNGVDALRLKLWLR